MAANLIVPSRSLGNRNFPWHRAVGGEIKRGDGDGRVRGSGRRETEREGETDGKT